MWWLFFSFVGIGWLVFCVLFGFFFCELTVLSDCKYPELETIGFLSAFLQTAESCIVLCPTFPTTFFSSMFLVCSYRHIWFLFSLLFVDPAPLFSCAAFTIRLFPSLPSQLIQTRLGHIGAIFLLFQEFVSTFQSFISLPNLILIDPNFKIS